MHNTDGNSRYGRMLVYGLLLFCSFLADSTNAAATAETAQRLRTDLTPTGAERAASSSGMVPAWNGGITTVPSNYQGIGTFHPDMFADEPRLATISANNIDDYSRFLNPAQQALLRLYNSYRIHLYPSHRTHSAPQWLYDNTYRNATGATLTADGAGIENVFGGVPFPIPSSGLEVLWNHLTRWRGIVLKRDDAEAIVFPRSLSDYPRLIC